MADKFYITTAIAYVNSKPHLGHALEFIQADVLARYHRLKGEEVYFLTGTDEHGSKNFQTAKEQGMKTRDFVDMNAAKFQELVKLLAITNDGFVRTSLEYHHKGAQMLWEKLQVAGDVYKDTYTGLYCVGCESFVSEKDLVEGKCPNHLKEPQKLSEENYFFRLSKYSAQIADLIKRDVLRVVPKSRRAEILRMAEDGLTDVSFSRPKSVLPWGVEVPQDSEHVMYVWCDALSNYITALDFENAGKLYQRYWPADVHLIGKDILRFHAGVWIGMLLSAGLPLPKAVFVHGFITSEGQKMSKSLGNVVDPLEMIQKYGLDPLRYYLLKEIPTTDDGDISQQRFKEVYQADLANNLGNLLSRVVTMSEKYFAGKIKADLDSAVSEKVAVAVSVYERFLANFDLKMTLEVIMELLNFANQYVDKNKPWELSKSDSEKLKVVLVSLLELLRVVSVLLYPFMPETAEKIALQLGTDFQGHFGDLVKFGRNDYAVEKGAVLFPRLEDSDV